MLKFPATLTVEVTAKDIANGKPRSSCDCPIARALHRTGGFHMTMVVLDAFVLLKGDFVTQGRYDIGPDAKGFVRMFDGGYPVEPFTFTATLITK